MSAIAHPRGQADDGRAWARGFRAAWAVLSPALARAESDADYWYARANNSPAEFRELRSDAAREGVAAYSAGGIGPADPPDPSASWIDARKDS
ncbi:hypothetical protein SAMN04487848_2063 [Microbacterium sp. ru370.1]|uniref:hypothetical protein n=1 Tax=unclassified Microbacterium TaxID=2609290 RepID=UPI000890E502|nr:MULTISPECIES: hypothetical protein [unclassified Microbacterium]SDO77799.1 hypothetical protein SAMN04487848_2063 [Microbacterium sp. ru370.1]SIT88971.1 hypothetical protein SAMN05880579_2058 [Microbacterium sp. RU1D]